MNFDMKKLIKKILANPVILFNKIVIGLYLHIMKTKTDDIKKLSLSGDRILVLAPHQDDEMLGCGCFIQQALRQGNKVKCVFMTDGSKSPSDVDESTLIKTRKAEALKVAEKLKMELPEFLDMEDGALDNNDIEASNKIINIIKKFQPNIIMVPYFLDGHKDHCAVSGIFIKAMELMQLNARLFAYEINSPISVYGITHYVDCTNLMNCKREALKIYESQTMSFESILLMNKLNGILSGTKNGAELFRELNLISYEKAYEKYNKDNNIWKRFRQMYSIYFMVIAYFKGIGLKKEIAMFQNAGDEQMRREEDPGKGITFS